MGRTARRSAAFAALTLLVGPGLSAAPPGVSSRPCRGAPSCVEPAGPAQGVLDLLIVNGDVVDGTGAARAAADVGIVDGRVVFVGPAEGRVARDTIDASGRVVAPGFIDAHNHTPPALAEPDRKLNEGFLRQGVTLVVGGPDGGLGPSDMAGLIDTYERQGVGTNVAFYVGHNAVRSSVMGQNQQRAPTAGELDRMRDLVRRGMAIGALGFSTGLMYEPGMYASTEEVITLARVAALAGGVYDSHVRDPVHDLLGSDIEVVRVATVNRMPAKIGHLKAVGLHNAGAIDRVIALVERARADGAQVVSDQYPYDGAATADLIGVVVIPDEVPGAVELRERLRARRRDGAERLAFVRGALAYPELRGLLKEASEHGIDGGFAWLEATGYTSMRVTHSPRDPELEGRYLSDLAQERGLDPFDLVAELLTTYDTLAVTLGAIREEDVQRLMVQPWNMIASDGAWADGGDGPGGHPRSTGTFARFLGHYVRELGLLPLEEAIRRVTSLPATFHGWTDRGVLQPGAVADVVVFDEATIRDRSTWTQPRLFSVGVDHVIVNGVPALRDGALTGEASGRFVPRATREAADPLSGLTPAAATRPRRP